MKNCLEFPKKKRFNVKQDAEKAIFLLDNKNIRVYLCKTCDGWHLSSKF